jgi:Tol biopolymer transport system component
MILTSCTSSKTVEFPDTEIIYQASDDEFIGEKPFNAIGFVNSDGTDSLILPIDYPGKVLQPSISEDGELLYFHTSLFNPDEIEKVFGIAHSLRTNRVVKSCSRKNGTDWFIFSYPGTKDIVFASTKDIRLVNPRNCKVVKTLMKLPDDGSLIRGFSISAQGDFIVFSKSTIVNGDNKFSIERYNLSDQASTPILIGGINPIISPDNREIAYLGDSNIGEGMGIYITDIDGNFNRLILHLSANNGVNSAIPPVPIWSPDGKWLVYHKCIREECEKRSDFNIYKVNVDTGVESLVITGGLYPIWR